METVINAVEANIKSLNWTLEHYKKEILKYNGYVIEKQKEIETAEKDYEALKKQLKYV